ncbi:hypothetical protein Vi05172_g2017 [Venturia inaequalis]|nr:hypothetical protein Vi05172_g2017 [Venturia inaequalis]
MPDFTFTLHALFSLSAVLSPSTVYEDNGIGTETRRESPTSLARLSRMLWGPSFSLTYT